MLKRLFFFVHNFYSFSHSDGGGRSGVYLSIDANLELAEEEDCYDVFGYLKTLRQSRKGMVETLVGVARLNVTVVRARKHANVYYFFSLLVYTSSSWI